MSAQSSSTPPPPTPGESGPDLSDNPGTYEELHRKCKDLYPVIFEGVKVHVQKPLSNHFQITHTLGLSQQANNYKFGATFVGTKQLGPQEAFPVLFGDTDFNGNVSATIIHQVTQRLRCKFQAQVTKSDMPIAQIGAEYRARKGTYSLMAANVDLANERGVYVAQYLHRLMPRLDVGIELTHQQGVQMPGAPSSMSVLSYGARYNGDWCTFSGTISRSMLHLCYYHKQSEGLQMGVEWETNGRMQESAATLSYQIDVPESGSTIRAIADSHWTVGCVIEQKLPQVPFTLALSAIYNHAKETVRAGIGFIVGQ